MYRWINVKATALVFFFFPSLSQWVHAIKDLGLCKLHLFLLLIQKCAEAKKAAILVLDPKRSNAINIGMTVLPAVHVIKSAILTFDEFAISKEGIEVM